MLLRSASTPILNSWTPHSKEPSSEPELLHQIQRTRSITLTVSCSSSLSILASDDSTRKMTKALSDTDLRNIAMPKRKAMDNSIFSRFCVEEEREEADFEWWTTDSHLVVEEGCGVGGGGGKFCGRRGWGGSDGGDDGGRSESRGSNHGNNSTDVYYQKMIEANPGNALLLSNYARFLKEVRGDLAKAEEYCGRAISLNPNDGAVLSMYADMIWQSHRDASRAASYFDQAVKAAPDDCYVLASYARFLWDAEDEVEEGAEEMSKSSQLQLSYLNAAPPTPPLTAAS